MTKEDILKKERKDLLRSDYKSILSAMDEWAKVIGVAFMRWNSHMYTEGRDRQRDKWFNHKGECVANSTAELFDQFIEVILKQGYQPWLFR